MRAIPFITLNNVTSKYEISDQAVAHLGTIKGCVAVLSFAGKYRTGKSFALNRMILDDIDAFPTGHTTQACTKGIWMYSKPVVWETDIGEQMNIIVLDSEGLASLDNSSNDNNVFCLLLLLSSMLIYNSSATIDDDALKSLSLVTNFTNNIRITSDQKSSTAELAKVFPSLCWLVRDFTLDMENTQGVRVDANTYLENALQPNNTLTDEVRAVIRDCFPDRTCVTMVRPCLEEEELKKLNNLPFTRMRPLFVEQVHQFRETIRKKIKNKQFFDNQVSGNILINMARSFVDAINNGAVPVLGDSYRLLNQIQETETFQMALDMYDQCLQSYEQSKQVKSHESLLRQLKEWKREAIIFFKQAVQDKKSSNLGKLEKQLQLKIEMYCQSHVTRVDMVLRDHLNNLKDQTHDIVDFESLKNAWTKVSETIFAQLDKTESVEAAWSQLSLQFLWNKLNKFDNLKVETFKQLDDMKTAFTKLNEEINVQVSMNINLQNQTRHLEELETKYVEQIGILKLESEEWERQLKMQRIDYADLLAVNEAQKLQISTSGTLRLELTEALQTAERFEQNIVQLKSTLRANDDNLIQFMEKTKLESNANGKKFKELQTSLTDQIAKLTLHVKTLEDQQGAKKLETDQIREEYMNKITSLQKVKDLQTVEIQNLKSERVTLDQHLEKARSELEESKKSGAMEAKQISTQFLDFQTRSNTKTRELETKLACGTIEIQNFKRRLDESEIDATNAKRLKFECQRLQSDLDSQKNITLYLERDKISKDQQVTELRDHVTKVEERLSSCQRQRDMELLKFQMANPFGS